MTGNNDEFKVVKVSVSISRMGKNHVIINTTAYYCQDMLSDGLLRDIHTRCQAASTTRRLCSRTVCSHILQNTLAYLRHKYVTFTASERAASNNSDIINQSVTLFGVPFNRRYTAGNDSLQLSRSSM